MPLDYNDPQYLDAETRAVIKLLRDAAARAIKLMLNPPGRTEKTKSFNASWAAARLKGINAELDAVSGKLAKIATAKVKAAYQVGIDAAEQMARSAGVSSEGSALAGSFTVVDMRRAQVLAQQAVRDLTLAVRSIRENTGKVVRKCQALGIDNAGVNLLLAGGTIDGVPKATLRQLRADIKTLAIDGKIITVNVETGAVRHFEPKYYADLVFQTKQAETATTALMERLQQRGLYYVRVIGKESANFCSAYVGKVFYIGPGDDPLGRFPSNRELPRGGPPFHPKCSKRFVAFFPDMVDVKQLEAATMTEQQRRYLGKGQNDLQKLFAEQQGGGK